MKIGFVGLGNMGQPMARNLLRSGHELTVYNRTRSRAEEFAAQGARVADSPRAAARGAEALVTMLADDAAVEAVVLGSSAERRSDAEAAIEALGSGAVHVSMSTISVALSRRLSEAHAARGQAYVAAPVFGRPEAAEGAKLWVVAAGEADAVERCRPVFDAVGRGLSVVSEEATAANVVKLAGNFLIASMIEALGEAFALSRKSGVGAARLLEIVNGALFKSPVYENYGRIVADERYEPAGFKLRLGLKDARLALAAADELAVPMPLASLIRDHFLSEVARGRGESDWAALARVSAESAGLSEARSDGAATANAPGAD